ncbi:hypothetical protein [Condylorrhiza vestigialis mutiple nucleopolyhedrovirus]|uniref:P22.2 n=1 Tax=Condylorrhiza vestigialis mutiple nucleopolyhedrovirus TaxID=1592576 RepID=A0A0B4UKY0_9ABAC|nr:hypothetical protein [Condylorrhiza vestigialis mutiple nucleopolyhedrovirus]AJD09187.1 hypothetical protein [Condylorrhiza vestigialis mutiple nucleopolyhedrovirus]
MKTPTVTVYYDDEEQDYVQKICEWSNGIVKIELTYNKQMGSDHVLKVYVETDQRTHNAFSFGDQTISVIDYNPTFDGFYDSVTRQTKQFRLNDYNTINQLMQHDDDDDVDDDNDNDHDDDYDEDNKQQLRKLADQIPQLNIVIKEWIDEAPMLRRKERGGFDIIDNVQSDGERMYQDECKSFTDSCKPVGYETNVLKYVDAKGEEGKLLAEIKIKFVSKQFINVV